jgi:hypothetical protein
MEMDAMWDKIKKGLKDGATLSMEKIEEYTKIGKLKLEELAANRKIDRNFADIGERVCDLIAGSAAADISADLTVKKGAENVKVLREEIASIQKKITEIAEAAKASHGKGAGDEDEVTGI